MYKRLMLLAAALAAVLLLAGCQSFGYVDLGPDDDYYYYGRDYYLDHPWYYHDYYRDRDHRDRGKDRYQDRENKKEGKKFSDYIREHRERSEAGEL